jgi:hypothetical protein
MDHELSLDQVNGTYACENDKTLNDILKREFGFQGCKQFTLEDLFKRTKQCMRPLDVMSDWGG